MNLGIWEFERAQVFLSLILDSPPSVLNHGPILLYPPGSALPAATLHDWDLIWGFTVAVRALQFL